MDEREDEMTVEEVERRLAGANVPTLVAVTYQLTGDRRWLEPPFRPTRSQGMDLNHTGGLSEEHRAELRGAAAGAISAWAAGAVPALPAPSGELLSELLDTVMGEPVPPEFEDMLAVSLGFRTPPPVELPEDHDDFFVVVVGAGVSGLLASLRLRDLGLRHVVLEKDEGLGGTWWENRYPGAGVDTPSHLYSYSFFVRPWSAHFAKRDEVETYLQDFVDTYGLRPCLRLGTEVTGMTFDPAAQRWTVTAASGETWEANAVISAVGLLNRPRMPDVPGLDTFEGTLTHPARWPADLDVDGKRVAVIGAGASAMQIVPAISGRVGHLTVYQRSPQWIAPNDDYFRPITADAQWLMDHVPFYRVWHRARLAWIFNDKVHPTLLVDPEWPHPDRAVNAVNDSHRRVFTRYLEEQLEGRDDLVAKALPTYPPFGKRMLLDNGWYAALRRDNVELVTDAIGEVTPGGVRTADGVERPADVIVAATGFDTQHLLAPMVVTGRSGRTLRQHWDDDDAHAHLGITVPDFPNLFLLLGPNTGLGHGGSVVTIVELQMDYVVKLLARMVTDRIGSVECRERVEAAYTERVRSAHDGMVWTHPGMNNWYRNGRGRVTATLPWRIVDYRAMLAEPDLDDFDLEPARLSSSAAPLGSMD
jgi:4-hydroxyacetophenone monooxygenase